VVIIVRTSTLSRSLRGIALAALAAGVAIVPLAGSGSAGTTAKTTRASIGSQEQESPDGGIYPSISGSGRYVVFEANSANLVPGDTNGESDVFVRDRKTGRTERVSVRSNGAQANSWSGYASVSANGRFVSFTSEASNLVQGDTNGVQDIFVHDRRTGRTTRVSVNSRGRQGNDDSSASDISATGRFVLVSSTATNLVRDDSNGYEDLFVHDRETGTTRLVSVRSNGAQANAAVGNVDPGSISTDGRFITFSSAASNLVKDDDNAVSDVFVRDRVAGKTTRVSMISAGDEANGSSRDPSISGDGKLVSFTSDATNLFGVDANGEQDIFVHNRSQGTTRRISVSSADEEADGFSASPSISADGRYVAFESFAENLIANDTNNDTDVFVRDRQRRTTVRVSLTNAGAEGNSGSSYPFISANGRLVAFQSVATNLIGNDTNAATDIYVRGPLRS
jgi:Tol biopolymer transport system component